MAKIVYVTEANLDGSNGASINSKGTYLALSHIGQCDIISGSEKNSVCKILGKVITNFEFNYDICWTRGLFSSALIETIKKPLMVYDINGILHEEYKLKGGNNLESALIYKFQKYCANHADLVKVHTQSMRKYFESCGVHTDYIQVPPIIDISNYQYIKKESNYGNVINVGYSGNARKWQGMPVLMDAFKHLEDESRIKLNLIGPSSTDVHINSNNVNLLDKCPHKDYISNILPKFDIFVVPRPSNIVTETTTPIKLIEAMACGIPIIASNVGGISEYVQHGKNAYLVEPDNPEKLAKAILKLSENPNMAMKLATNARTTAEKTFDYKAVGGMICKII